MKELDLKEGMVYEKESQTSAGEVFKEVQVISQVFVSIVVCFAICYLLFAFLCVGVKKRMLGNVPVLKE